MMKDGLRFILLLTIALLFMPMAPWAQESDKRPNILLILLDDVGFTNLGIYGGSAQTPAINALAASGSMFTRYYTTPLCGPSRAMLLTGMDNHQIGMGTLVETVSSEMSKFPGYSMEWSRDQKTVASRLKAVGYQTFVSGKWGIGRIGTNLPNRFGFDRSYILDATGASNYEARPYLPGSDSVQWFEDGKQIELPQDFYSSRDIVNKMVGYINEADQSKPFFGFVSLQAIHIPVQVPDQYIDRYNGVFDEGWDVMRKKRLQNAIDLGFVPETTTLAPSPDTHRAWESLSVDEKAHWARMMQVNAGMLEAADQHIGRLINHLKAKGDLENTLVIVTSDNGAEYSTIGHSPGVRGIGERLFLSIEGWNVDTGELGQRNSMGAIGPEWASVSVAPFNLYKFNTGDGGIRVPMVIAGPGVDKGKVKTGLANAADIVPTILEAAKVPFDQTEFFGRSQFPVLAGKVESAYSHNDGFGIEVSGGAAYLRDEWKITRVSPPIGDGSWRLYNMASDPGETTDLANNEPVVFQDLLNAYLAYSKKVGVFELGQNESAVRQLRANTSKNSFKKYWYIILPIILLTLLALILFVRTVMRALRISMKQTT